MKGKVSKAILDLKSIIIKILILVMCLTMLGLEIGSYAISIGNITVPMNTKTLKINNSLNNKYASKIADSNTMDSYIDKLISDEFGSRYAGRIWTDKSVTTQNITLDNNTDGYEGEITNNGEFLHTFSALGSSQLIKSPEILDMMFIIDISGSMGQVSGIPTMELEQTPILKTVNAINNAVDQILALNPETRIGITVYGTTAALLLPLGNYSVNPETPFLSVEALEVYGTTQGLHFQLTINAKNNKTGQAVVRCVNNAGKSSFDYHNGNLSEVRDSGNYIFNGTSGHREGEGTAENPYQVGHITNQQAGLATGLQALADAEETTWKSTTGQVRSNIPCMIHLTDGNASDISVINETSNWNNVNTITDIAYTSKRDSDNFYNVNQLSGTQMAIPTIFQTLMTASYYTTKVNKHYQENARKANIENAQDISIANYAIYASDNDPLEEMEESDKKTIIQAINNPSEFFTKESTDERIKGTNGVLGAYDLFEKWKTGEIVNDTYTGNFISIKLNASTSQLQDDTYGITVEDIEKNINYIERFLSTGFGGLNDVIKNIVEEQNTRVKNPINGKNNANVLDSLTYSDPIGEYMEVQNKGVIVNNKTQDMALLLFGEMYGINHVAVYDYNFNDNHRGENHNEVGTSNPFISGWYDSSGNWIGETGGNFDNGDTYYVDDETAREYVPTLPIENLTQKQKNTKYTFYKLDLSDTEISKYRWNSCYGEEPTEKQSELKRLYESNTAGIYKLSDIRIWTEYTGDYNDDTGTDFIADSGYDMDLYLNIPSNALPLQIANIKIVNNEIEGYETNLENKNQSTPIRLFYTVGINEKTKDKKGNIDLTQVSPEYLDKHTEVIDNKQYIFFYSNYYTGENYNKNKNSENTYGNTATTFTPAKDNSYYFFGKNSTIYKTSSGGEGQTVDTGGNIKLINPVTDINDIEPDKTYYFEIEYYVKGDNSKGKLIKYAISRKGSELYNQNETNHLTYYNTESMEEVGEKGPDVVVATKIGTRRIDNFNNFIEEKQYNETDTATYYYVPENGTNDNSIITYMGNNGRIGIENGLILITKTVSTETDKNTIQSELNEEFEFTLTLEGAEGTKNVIVAYEWNGERWVPEYDSILVITDNKGYILDFDGNPTKYWVGISEEERTVNKDGTIVTYSNSTKENKEIINVYESDRTIKKYKTKSTFKTKELLFDSEGKAKFELKDGEAILLSGIKSDINYEVKENVSLQNRKKGFKFLKVTGREGDTILVEGTTISSTTEGNIVDEANYTNMYVQAQDLTIRKKVEGETAEPKREWTFKIELIPPENAEFFDSYKYIGNSYIEGVEKAEDGTLKLIQNNEGNYEATIKLKHGQEITIKDIPKDTRYKVTEEEANIEDYQTTYTNEKGKLDKDMVTECINKIELADFEFTKIANEDKSIELPGTEFSLYRLVCTNPEHTKEEHDKLINTTKVSDCWKLERQETSGTLGLIGGKVEFKNLVEGKEYRLIETKAAIDRLKPEGQWKIINTEGEWKITAVGEENPPAFLKEEGKLFLPNVKIYNLPVSGGTGTNLYSTIGLILIIAGMIIYIINLRKNI